MNHGQADNRVERVIDRIRVAINDHDLEALASCFAADYLNETPVHPARGFRGREQVRRNWEQIFAGVPDIEAQVVRTAMDGDIGWSEWDMGGTRLDGSSFRMRGVAIYRVTDDRAASCRFYLEPVDEGSEEIEAATQRVVTGGSGERKEGPR